MVDDDFDEGELEDLERELDELSLLEDDDVDEDGDDILEDSLLYFDEVEYDNYVKYRVTTFPADNILYFCKKDLIDIFCSSLPTHCNEVKINDHLKFVSTDFDEDDYYLLLDTNSYSGFRVNDEILKDLKDVIRKKVVVVELSDVSGLDVDGFIVFDLGSFSVEECSPTSLGYRIDLSNDLVLILSGKNKVFDKFSDVPIHSRRTVNDDFEYYLPHHHPQLNLPRFSYFSLNKYDLSLRLYVLGGGDDISEERNIVLSHLSRSLRYTSF